MEDRRAPAPWDVSIVGTPGGLMVHLVENRVLHTHDEPRALCGNKASTPTRTPFQLNGCKRCCKAALKKGLTTVIDVNAEVVDVQAVLDQ
jgi:hypothetical protein